jgi:uncharacterized protein
MTYHEVIETVHRYRVDNAHRYPIVRLGVFGSAARQHMTDASDVDIVVELAEPDLFVLIGIKQELEELLQRPVDIVRYRKEMNEALKQRIDAEAVYV